jgi:hypothetical protein
MERKFKPGDVVRYVDTDLQEVFTTKFGTGPFIVIRWRDSENVFLSTMDGQPMPHPKLKRKGIPVHWHHGVDGLEKDEFLSAVNQAKYQTKKEKVYERKNQKRRAIGNSASQSH